MINKHTRKLLGITTQQSCHFILWLFNTKLQSASAQCIICLAYALRLSDDNLEGISTERKNNRPTEGRMLRSTGWGQFLDTHCRQFACILQTICKSLEKQIWKILDVMLWDKTDYIIFDNWNSERHGYGNLSSSVLVYIGSLVDWQVRIN